MAWLGCAVRSAALVETISLAVGLRRRETWGALMADVSEVTPMKPVYLPLQCQQAAHVISFCSANSSVNRVRFRVRSSHTDQQSNLSTLPDRANLQACRPPSFSGHVSSLRLSATLCDSTMGKHTGLGTSPPIRHLELQVVHQDVPRVPDNTVVSESDEPHHPMYSALDMKTRYAARFLARVSLTDS